jgi:[ribosomal protein S18]-alanine N-acetyltransferase
MPKCSTKSDLKVQIRLATLSDIKGMMELDRGSPTASHWSLEQYEALFTKARSGFSERFSLVVEGQSQEDQSPNVDVPALCIFGYLAARRVENEWELENVVVAENVRRLGLGLRLMSELIEHARHGDATSIFLEVRESNHLARALYQKMGFQETGRRKGYYSNPLEDAIIYRRNA